MKSSLAPQETERDGAESEDGELTATEVSDKQGHAGSARPSLARSPPGRLSEISQTLAHRQPVGWEEGRVSTTAGRDTGQRLKTGIEHNVKGANGTSQSTVTEAERVTKMREAMNSKLLQQQRTRRSYGNPITESVSKRVSPIQEEDGPYNPASLDAAVASPPTSGRTNSTISTESTTSSKTVRASKPATPAANAPLRTPSYPFPYVPGTPRGWSSGTHQPFTALSPTAGGMPNATGDTPGRDSGMLSSNSTPGPGTTAFLPPGTVFQMQEDPRFPTPNLYDLVLQLNAEPGLEQWWATVTNMMHDHYKADRVTLVMPLDPTDMENVPWGQKATFSMNGPEEFVPHGTVMEQVSKASASHSMTTRPEFASRESSFTPSDFNPQKLHQERLRPRLEARHSYAGHGREAFSELPAPSPGRPAGPKRTATHAAGMVSGGAQGRSTTVGLPSTSAIRHGSLNDPDFSSIAGGVDAGPYAEVFSSLRALDHEVRPLIEPGGVCRVLDRGQLVTVTRDYAPSNSDSNSTNGSTHATEPDTPKSTPSTIAQFSMDKIFGNYRSIFSSDKAPSGLKDYEEYEQYPASPWSQSPAPSPAMQDDEDRNPFFASNEQKVEDSFDPAASPNDYTQSGQVEAIGVDRASTVIHIPLVHPTLSQPMQSLQTYSNPGDPGAPPKRSNTLDVERKAPLAILSILSSTVPFPQNLTQSLKLLGPHLATSIAVSQQFSSMQAQAVTIRHRRTASGHNISQAPMTIEPTSLEDIANAKVEGPAESLSGSVTSPSEYSNRSTSSPTGSIVGTPGWDPATHGWTSSRSVSGTPGMSGTEMVDNYFEAKKRSGQRSGSNSSGHVQGTPIRQVRKRPSQENDHAGQKPSQVLEEATKPPHRDLTSNVTASITEQKSPYRSKAGYEHPISRLPETKSTPRPSMRNAISQVIDPSGERRHHQLHSFGVDLQSSFGALPSSTSESQDTAFLGHARKPSYPEDMPPPSERLLRTIIDSVPVQIFTAEPETGKLTWVNSKFLIYRGQEARQILSEPWQAIHADDRKEFMASWHRSLRTTQQLQQKVRLERFDGSYRWFYVRAAPLKDKRQKIVHWIGTMMDFHEQHIAEVNSARQQETAASEAKYRALANSSPQVVFSVNKTKGVTFCNTQWAHFSGQTEAQALGVGFMDHVHPDDLAKCKLPTFDEGSDQPRNVPTSVPPDLRRKYSASVSSNASSETEKGTSSAESSPLTTQLPQRKLSELANTGILKVSLEVDGRPSYSTEVRLKSKDGDYRWHLVRVLLAEPLLQSSHEEETWYGTCTDINDHKALERDLKETMDEKSRFLSNMSHEIRTPLNGITGMVNFLIDSTLTVEQLEHLHIIRASTEGLRGLINDILDLSKAEAGMINLTMDWLYIRALIEEVNDLTSVMAIEKGLELNYLVEDDVAAQIKGDRFRMRQILLNVIGNAIKFTEKGEVFVRCSTHHGNDDELSQNELIIKFEVIDTGRGFTNEEAEHLFKRFSQIDGSSTRQHGGTGLGLVISRQLAQLHGGDMYARGVPGKGATFMFTIKTSLPSSSDQPPPPTTPGVINIPMLPMSPGPMPPMSRVLENVGKPSPKYGMEYQQSPSPYTSSPGASRESPSASSASSSMTGTSSLRSERSSASSYMQGPSFSNPPMKLALPTSKVPSASGISVSLLEKDILTPPMYSILVVCPLKYSREATVQHIDKILPPNVPHQITARETVADCQKLLSGEDSVLFTHIVLVLKDIGEIGAVLDQVLTSPSHQSTSIVIISDLAQRRDIMEQFPSYDYDRLATQRRLRFVFKPLKPSRIAVVFDPQKEREMSTDRNQDSAQQIALNQKQVFEEVASKLGKRDKRVLLVEDNRTNQLVVTKFLTKTFIDAEIAVDGVECVDKVFSHPHDYYSVILCDLHMPNKDGYQACKEIRKWERQNKLSHLPIIALSANVLGDVYQKCVDAGFNSYLTKPVDFRELSVVLMTFMDPTDPSKPHEFMKKKRRQSVPQR